MGDFARALDIQTVYDEHIWLLAATLEFGITENLDQQPLIITLDPGRA